MNDEPRYDEPRFLTDQDITPELWALLKRIGLPDRCTEINIKIRAGAIIEVRCAFIPYIDGKPEFAEERVGRYRLIDVTEEYYEKGTAQDEQQGDRSA